MHLKMVRIRRFEENAGRMMEDGKFLVLFTSMLVGGSGCSRRYATPF